MRPIAKSSKKNENYEILNLIGYGLAKFDLDLVKQFGFKNKSLLFRYFVEKNVAETVGTVKNRQDLFDALFPESQRKGWWQHGPKYMHRKQLIDSLFGDLNVISFAELIKLYLRDKLGVTDITGINAAPILRSRFKQLQITGQEAELYFLLNYNSIDILKGGSIEDARLFGDGYDFQIQLGSRFILAEVKGMQMRQGAVRMTEKEYLTAEEYQDDYGLAVVSSLNDAPRMNFIANPVRELRFRKYKATADVITYHSEPLAW
jgi:hypothetical protein